MTGIGVQRFTSDFMKLLSTADLCIVSGLAGSLIKEHTIGTVVVSKTVKRDGSDSTVVSDESLVKTATECGATPSSVLCTTNTVVTSASEKSRLGKIADAVDMESFQVMTETRKYGVPAVAIRAISDTADHNLPLDFNRVIDGAGNIGWLPVLSQVAASPRCLPQLVRFGLESSKAARKLGTFLDRYLKCLIVGAHSHLMSTRMEVR
jgi:adenosylhomocysteine nucleosidase